MVSVAQLPSDNELARAPAPTPQIQSTGKCRNLTESERRRVYCELLASTNDGNLAPGTFGKIAQQFGCHAKTVQRIWDRGQASIREGAMGANVDSKRKGKCGAKRKHSPLEIEEAIKRVDQIDRQTLRSLASASGIPKTAIVKHMKEEKRLKARSSYVKPALSEKNKEEHMKFALSFLQPGPCGKHIFSNMHDYVHVDEKWFFMAKVKRKFYVYDDEELALRSVKNKSHITEIMFLAAVARPRHDHHLKREFDGKIGIWPIVQNVAAQRSSKNRPKGTIVVAPLSVDALVYKAIILEKVAPAILAKFPRSYKDKKEFIQQDNASPHRCITTELLRSSGFTTIDVANQPPNSPDFNVLDLGYFNSIQSLQYQKQTRSIEELIDAVENSFHEMPSGNLSKTFITLQTTLRSSLVNFGCNDFKIEHLKKDSTIPNIASFNLECDDSVCKNALL
ncbi:hypothetical protein AeRB84_002581 [Aphanomyces euteiches]|nr:hypothetical protein AeRB84_002581 [Aphanomyces euteiches]